MLCLSAITMAEESGEVLFESVENAEGNFVATKYFGFAEGETLVCAHTNDALDKPLSSYNFSSLRYIHIEGVRIEVSDDNCFTDLYEGISLSIPTNSELNT